MRPLRWPLLLILVGVIGLLVFPYWYEQHWGVEGPFPVEHHHH
ncbi:MAG: hypothetical protein N3B01_11095 [Verrucomicrobiae bacterium]|nr:hypothetical protein [Verrucomicrobiae bacterium]